MNPKFRPALGKALGGLTGLPVVLLLLTLIAACSGWKQESFTVSKVIQNAEKLEGKAIRVRGEAYQWIKPSRETMWMYGGCVPVSDPSYRPGVTTGWLTLYDHIDPEDLQSYGTPHNAIGIKISESSFNCSGDFCKLTCSSFEAVSQRTYELIGVLRVNAGPEFILENVDLEQSRQLVDGKWMPLQKGDFDIWFP